MVAQSKFQVLVVDDDPELRAAIEQCLKYMGCAVVLASNGADALNILKTQEFSLVLTDVQMPHMDGVTLLEAIHQQNIEVPVVIMSGFNDYNDQEIDKRDGAVYLQKPVSRDQLEEIVSIYMPVQTRNKTSSGAK